MCPRTLIPLAVSEVRRALGRPDYWHREAPEGRHIDTSSPRGYYFDYSARVDYEGPRDAIGVPMLTDASGRPEYSPPDVAQFAFGNLELYMNTGNERRRRLFEAAAAVLMRTAEEVPGSYIGWPMPVAPRALATKLGSGWFSGMAHGECVSVLARAGSLFRVEGAIECASRAMGGFHLTVDDGGLLREVGAPGQEGGLESVAFIEEYPMLDRPSLVLNGHVHAMWGIYDHWKVTHDHASEVLFDRCVRGLKFVLDRYDLGYWTRYDLDGGWSGVNPASPIYHRIHVTQMKVLHRMTGDQALLAAARRWEAYAASPLCRARAYWRKVRFKVRNRDSVVG